MQVGGKGLQVFFAVVLTYIDINHIQLRVHAPGHPGCPGNQVLSSGVGADAHRDTLAYRPIFSDVLADHIGFEGAVYLLGHLPQGQLAQRDQITPAEEVLQGLVHLFRAVHIPSPHPVRSASGVRSTITVSVAFSSTHSGTVSRTLIPVMDRTTGAILSTCWMLTVDRTSSFADRSSSTSSYRLRCLLPGIFVCASSSTKTTCGRRARTASTSISSKVVPLYSIFLRGTVSSWAARSAMALRPCVSTTPMTTSSPRLWRRMASLSML